MIILREYQQEAVQELLDHTQKLLAHEPETPKTIVFKAPTGSGKTLMVATYIQKLLQEVYPADDLCFLWVSVGSGELHLQSARALDAFFGGDPAVSTYEQEYVSGKTRLDPRSIAVVNWEKLYNKNKATGEWKNRVMRDSGDFSSFQEVLPNTRMEGAKIILVIDESHKGHSAERTRELRDVINAHLTLEVSATPTLKIDDADIKRKKGANVLVLPEEVIAAGMIKKSIPINPDVARFDDKSDESTSEKVILDAAFARRAALLDAFKEEGARINPLVLVQLPDSKAGDAKRETVVNYLLERGISTENGLLAIWLSNEKINLEGIRDMDSPVQFLLFKQAVATGWDCPRAQVLVMFRDIKSEPFKIQTVGRILRMPEQKHYLKEDLNKGYVYTNIYPLSVEEEAGEPTGILQNITVRKREGLENVTLVSYYRQRADYNDLTTSFYALQNRVFCEVFGLETYGLVDKEENHRRIRALGMNFDLGRSDAKMGKEGMMVMDRYDEYGYTTKNIALTEHVTHISDSDVQFAFDKMLLGFLSTYNRARSLPTLRKSLYDWFNRHFDYSPMNGGALAVQHLVLRAENTDKIKTALQKAVDEYEPLRVNEVESKAKDKMNPNWRVPDSAQYSDISDETFPANLNFYNECWLSKTRSSAEKAFEKWLESKYEQVEWWYKNGESKETYFGVQYAEGDVTRTFYPDYLVRFKNGSIGIFDTKDGMTAKDAGFKAEALQRYFKEFHGTGKKGLWGGILVERTSGVWMLNQSEAYRFDGKDWSGWEFLEKVMSD